MDKTNKIPKAKRRGIFINMTRKESKKEIRKIEEAEGRRLSRAAKIKIIKKNARKAKIYTTIAVASLLLGGIGGSKVTNLLEPGKTEISIDADQYKDRIHINHVTNDREVFLNGLRVESDEIGRNEALEQGVIDEINSLENSEEVLNYIKQIYLDEYKQKNGGDATIDDVKLRKDRVANLYEDVAQNGDEIIRKGISKTNKSVDSNIGLLSALVQDGGENYMEDAVWDGKEYKNVYEQDEVVPEDKESILQDIGAIIEHGIDYYSGFIDEQESDIYKQRLIDAVTEYKYEKINEIIKPSMENTNQQIEDETEMDR